MSNGCALPNFERSYNALFTVNDTNGKNNTVFLGLSSYSGNGSRKKLVLAIFHIADHHSCHELELACYNLEPVLLS